MPLVVNTPEGKPGWEKALDEWEYPFESVTSAKNELRAAGHAIGLEMDEIQKVIDDGGQDDGSKEN